MRNREGKLRVEAAKNTKVEALAEALEDVCAAIVADGLQKVSGENHAKIGEFLAQSRFTLRETLTEFLRPTLNLVQPRQHSELWGRVRCGRCHRGMTCEPNCEHWARALRNKIAQDSAREDNDEGPRAA